MIEKRLFLLIQGGRHVDYVADQVTAKLIDTIKKKVGKSGVNVKPFQVNFCSLSLDCYFKIFDLLVNLFNFCYLFISVTSFSNEYVGEKEHWKDFC